MGLRETLEAATPGPWLLSYSGNFVVTEDALVIAETGTYQMPKENARLIALAPELASLVLRVQAIATRGVGPDTTPEEALATIAAYIEKRLARLDRIGKEQQ